MAFAGLTLLITMLGIIRAEIQTINVPILSKRIEIKLISTGTLSR
jgi:hypothetical protein